eukprot:m.182200 g.182200  ORF g.182200 m.182200 type:complete len:776 (-) comp15523_c0_seq17:189-2516(-)
MNIDDSSSDDGTGFPPEMLEMSEDDFVVSDHRKDKDSTVKEPEIEGMQKRDNKVSPKTHNMEENDTHLAVASVPEPGKGLILNGPDYEQLIKVLNAAKTGDVETLKSLIKDGTDVNFKNAFGETPLILVLRGHLLRVQLHVRREDLMNSPALDRSRIETLRILVDHGANVNEETFDKPPVTVLGLALQCQSVEAIKILLANGADPVLGLKAVTNVLLGVNMRAVQLLVREDVLCSSTRPIEFCFSLGYAFGRLANTQPERRREYKDLRNTCASLAVQLLDLCPDLWDVRRLLNPTSGILNLAMTTRQKAFLSHTYTQAYLNEIWLGNLHGRSGDKFWLPLLACLAFPVTVPALFVWYLIFERRLGFKYSTLGDLVELLETPFVKFMGSVLSFVAFVSLLIVIVDGPSGKTPNTAEMVAAIWVFSLIFSEIREMIQCRWDEYWSSRWNSLDWVILVAFLCVIAIRIVIWQEVVSTDRQMELLHAANGVLALSCGLTTLRLLHIMQANSLLGPLQLIIAGIMKDLAKFLVFLAMFMVAFSLALTKVYENSTDPSGPLGSVWRTLETLGWALFGLVELDMLEPSTGEFRDSTEAMGKVLFAIYMITVFILLINLLIAMLSSTYNRISSNADIEWKYARAMLIRSYQEAPIVPPPLNLISDFFGIIWRYLMRFIPTNLCSSNSGPLKVLSPSMKQNLQRASDEEEERAMVTRLELKLIKRYIAEQQGDDEIEGKGSKEDEIAAQLSSAVLDKLLADNTSNDVKIRTAIVHLNKFLSQRK